MKDIRNCRKCAKSFTPRVRTQRYCSPRCKNGAAQVRLRKRAKQYTKDKAAQRTTVSAA